MEYIAHIYYRQLHSDTAHHYTRHELPYNTRASHPSHPGLFKQHKRESRISKHEAVIQWKHAPGPQDPPATLLANVGGSRKSVLRREVERSIYINPTTFYRNPKATSRGTLLPFGSPTLDIKNERTPLDLR